MSRTRFVIAIVAAAALSLGVSPCEPTPTPDTEWYYTCGDPVCHGYSGPYDDIPLCTDQEEGDPCLTEGQTCDPVSECNQLVVCAETDPKAEGCPISRAAYKRDIHYLSPTELGELHRQVIDAPLATWKYKSEGDEAKTRLGFIIEDQVPGSLAVDEPRDMVDVYAWSTMAVAALKVQEDRIAALEAQVKALEAKLDRQ